jgi:hypothetical protein
VLSAGASLLLLLRLPFILRLGVGGYELQEATIVLLLVTVGFAFFRLNNSLASRVGLGLRGKRA